MSTSEHDESQKLLLDGQATLGQSRICAETEVLSAVLAAIGHGLVVFAHHCAGRTTMTANRLIAPAFILKELARGLLLRELLEELKGG